MIKCQSYTKATGLTAGKLTELLQAWLREGVVAQMAEVLGTNAPDPEPLCALIQTLKRKTCMLYSAELTQVLQSYFASIKDKDSEPTDVHPQVVALVGVILGLPSLVRP